MLFKVEVGNPATPSLPKSRVPHSFESDLFGFSQTDSRSAGDRSYMLVVSQQPRGSTLNVIGDSTTAVAQRPGRTRNPPPCGPAKFPRSCQTPNGSQGRFDSGRFLPRLLTTN
jgi:hypothetical protein